MKKETTSYQLVSLQIHRRNTAEKAISTFKNHFIAGLASINPKIRTHLWFRLLPQVILTLKLLHQSRISLNLSTYAQLHRQYDYNTHPVAPLAIQVLIHEKINIRRTWTPHEVEG